MSHRRYGKTVWILGAGFSRSLGGPLMDDLLAYMEFDHIVESLGCAAVVDPHCHTLAVESFDIRTLFAYGLAKNYWQHAEHFLDTVETALVDTTEGIRSAATAKITPLLRTDVGSRPTFYYEKSKMLGQPLYKAFMTVDDLVSAARRAIAADTWTFLKGAHVAKSERWSPYVKWSENLDARDTIVTFNYDQIPEMLADPLTYPDDPGRNIKLHVISPHDFETNRRSVTRRQLAPVLKLHGSTTWTNSKSDGYTKGAPPSGLVDLMKTPLMGFPGPGKLSHCRTKLNGLWAMARDALLEANTIIFIGYRFPPTDSYSRQTILEAIASNRKELAQVITVLGDNLNHPDARRMESLLLSVRRQGAKHTAMPLFCEDFLDEFHRPVD